MVPDQGAAAGLRGPDGDPGRLDEGGELLRRVGVQHAATGDDDRTLRRTDRRHRTSQGTVLRQRATDVPLARLQERHRDVEGLGLHVLRQGDRHGAGLGRVGQDAHRGEGDREQLLGPLDAVEEARQGPERVGHLQRGVVRHLDLLQDRVGGPGREGVGRQQRRGAGSSSRGGRCQHVRGARADGRRRREGRTAAVHAREADGLVHHRLLVAGLVVGQQAGCSTWSCLMACPSPATLPCPKMPKIPGMVRSRWSPSTVHWFARNSTSAWPTVIRRVCAGRCAGSSGGLLLVGQAGVELLARHA